MTSISISRSLERPVKDYCEKRKYMRLSQAANELIRIGLETEEKRQ